MNKFDRRNRAKQMRLNKDNEHAKNTNVFAGKDESSPLFHSARTTTPPPLHAA
jgi:hypothetical protein